MSSVNLMEAHTQWAHRPADQRFQTLEALTESVSARRRRSRAMDVSCDRVKATVETISEKPVLLINGTITPSEPSHWAFGQLAAQVKAPGGYLRTLTPQLAADCLNYGISRVERDAVKFMTIAPAGEGLPTLQAVTSPKYGRIWDADVCEAVGRVVQASGGRWRNPRAYAHHGDANGFQSIDTSRTEPSGLYASDRDVFIFMVDGGSMLDAGPRAKLNRGFIAWNSETGSRTFGLMTFLFNTVCGNHIIWGAQDVNKLIIRHTGGGPTRFDVEAAPLLNAYANAAAAPVESTIRKAQSLLIGDSKETVTEYLNRHGKFTRDEIDNAYLFARAEDGDCRTLWHAVQGLTAYARAFEYVDARVDLETRAGRLLDLADATAN